MYCLQVGLHRSAEDLVFLNEHWGYATSVKLQEVGSIANISRIGFFAELYFYIFKLS